MHSFLRHMIMVQCPIGNYNQKSNEHKTIEFLFVFNLNTPFYIWFSQSLLTLPDISHFLQIFAVKSF